MRKLLRMYMQKITIHNLNDILGKTVVDVRNYRGLISIHFNDGPPLFLSGTSDQGVVWQDILCGSGSKEALIELGLYDA